MAPARGRTPLPLRSRLGGVTATRRSTRLKPCPEPQRPCLAPSRWLAGRLGGPPFEWPPPRPDHPPRWRGDGRGGVVEVEPLPSRMNAVVGGKGGPVRGRPDRCSDMAAPTVAGRLWPMRRSVSGGEERVPPCKTVSQRPLTRLGPVPCRKPWLCRMRRDSHVAEGGSGGGGGLSPFPLHHARQE